MENSTEIYLKEIGKIPLLTTEEEVELAKRIEAGDEEARKKFCESNLKLVISIAKKYISYGIPLLDLVQEGNIGLMKAIDNFDYRKGHKFSTYATYWIRQAITVAVKNQSRLIRLPENINIKVNQILRTRNQLMQETGFEPVPEEIAERTGIDLDEVNDLLESSQFPFSLDVDVSPNDNSKAFDETGQLRDFISDDESISPEKNIDLLSLREELEQALNVLNDQEKEVIRMRFGLDDGVVKTQKEVGDEFGLTKTRIGQIERKALSKLKNPEVQRVLIDFVWQ